MYCSNLILVQHGMAGAMVPQPRVLWCSNLILVQHGMAGAMVPQPRVLWCCNLILVQHGMAGATSVAEPVLFGRSRCKGPAPP